MVKVDPTNTLIGPHGRLTLLDAFESRRQLIVYYFMWHTGHPAPEQCEGCTWVTTRVREFSYCTLATAPSPCSAKGRTVIAPATAILWAGRKPMASRRTGHGKRRKALMPSSLAQGL
jgi:hypothetical protein